MPETLVVAQLHAELESRFLGGAVLHTGRGRFELEERILAAPIAALWA